MSPYVLAPDDPRAADVKALLATHLAFARMASPPEDVHALDVTDLLGADVSFVSLRVDGDLRGVGALKQLDAAHGELKSMHTAAAARGQGVGRAVLAHLLETARARGYHRVSLETGSMEAFAPARALYRSAGFEDCAPFADYTDSPHSTFMSRVLAPLRLGPVAIGAASRGPPARCPRRVRTHPRSRR